MKKFAILAVLTGLASGQAMADIMTFNGFAYANQTHLAFNIHTASANEAVYAGAFSVTLNGTPNTVFCVDLAQTFSWNTPYSNYSQVAPGSATLNPLNLSLNTLICKRVFDEALGASVVVCSRWA